MQLKNINNKQELLSYLFEKGVMITPAFLKSIENKEQYYSEFVEALEKKSNEINPDSIDLVEEFNKVTPDNSQITPEKKEDIIQKTTSQESPSTESKVIIKFDYQDFEKKREIGDFVKYFNRRYSQLSKILRARPDVTNLVSINKLTNNFQTEQNRDKVSIIGMIFSISETKNGHKVLEVEDPTGKMKVIISKNREDLMAMAKELVCDEVIALQGQFTGEVFFPNKIYFPEVPMNREFKKSPDEAYMCVLSDLQFGSDRFMHDEFTKFLKWINGQLGSKEQRHIAKNLKYVILAGDIVEGIGIFPGQDNELEFKDIKQQFDQLATYLKLIPKHIKMIYSPGNHEPVRLAEPQPKVSRTYAEALYALPNIIFISNPGIVNVHSSNNFPGFDILIYHGYSFYYYADQIERIRDAGGSTRMDLVQSFLLQKRHLAPTHTSNTYIPDITRDPLVIEEVPDFFISGHVHHPVASNYRHCTCIIGSCWDGVSDYALKFGSRPLPARLPIVNLQTREIRIMKFNKEEK